MYIQPYLIIILTLLVVGFSSMLGGIVGYSIKVKDKTETIIIGNCVLKDRTDKNYSCNTSTTYTYKE